MGHARAVHSVAPRGRESNSRREADSPKLDCFARPKSLRQTGLYRHRSSDPSRTCTTHTYFYMPRQTPRWLPKLATRSTGTFFRNQHAQHPAALIHPPSCGAIVSRALATSSGRAAAPVPRALLAGEHASALPVSFKKQGRRRGS